MTKNQINDLSYWKRGRLSFGVDVDAEGGWMVVDDQSGEVLGERFETRELAVSAFEAEGGHEVPYPVQADLSRCQAKVQGAAAWQFHECGVRLTEAENIEAGLCRRHLAVEKRREDRAAESLRRMAEGVAR